jgi:hypothetical protein
MPISTEVPAWAGRVRNAIARATGAANRNFFIDFTPNKNPPRSSSMHQLT